MTTFKPNKNMCLITKSKSSLESLIKVQVKY